MTKTKHEKEAQNWLESSSIKENTELRPKTELEILEESLLSNSKEDINFSTKIKTFNEKIWILSRKKSESNESYEKNKIQEEINILNREKNRFIRMNTISRGKKIEWIGGIEKEDIESIGAKKLLQIEKEKLWFLSSAFAYKQEIDKDWNNIENPITNPNDIKEWDNIIIDFGRNSSANKKIWAWDILPSNIRAIKVTDTSWNTRSWTRMVSWSRVWYYDELWKYIPIFNNYKLYIPKSNELATKEFTKFWLKSNIIDNKEELAKINDIEQEAKDNYITILTINDNLEITNDIVSEISSEIWDTSTYKEKLQKIIAKANEYKNSDSKYSSEDLELVIARLNKTLEIIWDKDYWFDWDKYKESIAELESSTSWLYFARNDSAWRARWISSEKWAWWKYQFTTETLRWFWVNLWNPPIETNIQEFLANSSLQEEIMDKYMIKCLEKHIIPNQDLMTKVDSQEKNISYYLALTHIGWPWALKKWESKDWLGTSTVNYASRIEESCSV